jgi:hypothetical protein
MAHEASARARFNGQVAADIADHLGVATRSRSGRSARFAYFEDDARFVVVAGPQEGRDVDLALAYGLTWRGTRELGLVLPQDCSTATRQRMPWLAPGIVRLWEHGSSGVVEQATPDRADALEAVREQGATDATPVLRADDDAGADDPVARHLGSLADDLGLDPAHRRGQRSWHVHGLRVLSMTGSRGGHVVRAGVHRGDTDRAPLTRTLVSDLDDRELHDIRAAVLAAADERRTPGEVPGGLHRPDEHWLQSVLRSRPGLADLEEPVHREVPAWRPTDGGGWARGFIDLLGRGPDGSIRLVETKVAGNDDARFVLQALDYFIWASAHRPALADALGLDRTAPVDLRLLVGADVDGGIALSRYSPAIARALADDVPWTFAAVRDWFGGEPRSEVGKLRHVPERWSNDGRSTGNDYVDAARSAAVRWKQSTPSLPDDARRPGPYLATAGAATYEFCLPAEHAAHNLLPAVRQDVLEHVATRGIAWHRGMGGGPTTHLLSSQVQCMNALGRMIRNRDLVAAAFREVLPIEEVVPMDGGEFLTFEWVPTTDVLGEAGAKGLRRGAGNTSLDAAFRFTTREGTPALALVEWKFTESYLRPRPIQAAADLTRTSRYAHLVQDPDGPIDSTVLPFEDLLDEPFYQLVRQQLLAHAVETGSDDDAQEVHVVHVLPGANEAYQRSLVRETHRARGETVADVWRRLYPALGTERSRYHHLDPSTFLDADVTSPEYVARYTIPAG